MKRQIICLPLLIVCWSVILGQVPIEASNLPRKTPQSPNSFAFEQFGKIPVNYSTGIASFHIPLYDISLDGVRIPINLQYQSNGLKPDEIPTWIGLGWNLNFGGVITYEQRGKSDSVGMLLPGVYNQYQRFFNNQMTSTERYWYLDSIMKGLMDCEFDVYNFNFNGISGQFFSKPDGSLITTLEQGLIVTRITDGFKIVDASGAQYFFESREYNYVHSNCGDPMNPDFNDNAAFYLSKIVTTGNRTVLFKYKSYYFNYDKFGKILYHRPVPANEHCQVGNYSGVCSSYEFNNLLIDSIVFDNGIISFQHSEDPREDIQLIDEDAELPSLDQITITNDNGKLVSTFSFEHEYFDTNKRLKLKKVIQSAEGSENKEYTFEYFGESGFFPFFFSKDKDHAGYYNARGNVQLIPYADYSFLPLFGTWISVAVGDRRSNFDAAKSGLLKKVIYPTGGNTEFVYEPNQIRLKSYTNLKSKSIFFDYPFDLFSVESPFVVHQDVESATITDTFTVSSEKLAWVEIIKEIPVNALMDPEIHFTSGPATTINFLNNLSYTCANGICSASKPFTIEPGTYIYTMSSGLDFDGLDIGIECRIRLETEAPYEVGGGRIKKIISSGATSANEIMIKEIIYDDREDSVSLKLAPNYMKYTDVGWMSDLVGGTCGGEWKIYEEMINPPSTSNVLYNRVTEKNNGSSDIGETVFVYNRNDIGAYSQDPYVAPQDMNWRFDIIRYDEYKNASTGTPVYELAKKTLKEATVDASTVYHTGLRASYSLFHYGGNTNGINQFIVTGTVLAKDKHYLKQQKDYLYEGSDFITNTTNYKIASSHVGIIETNRLTSRADSAKQKIIYSFDYDSTTVSSNEAIGIRLLKRLNINTPIEVLETKKISGTEYVINAKLTTYKSDKAVPDRVYRLKITSPIALNTFTLSSISGGNLIKDSRYEEQLNFVGYDEFNNVREMKKTGDLSFSYIWDHKSMFVVAECENADTTSAAYTSFETDNKGGWTYSGSNAYHSSAPTGTKGYSLAGGNITRSGLSSGSSYIVTYWKRDSAGTATVNSGSGASLAVHNGWVLYRHEITGTTSLTISGTAYIDELRVHPKNAFMTTYTYEPLVGMTSKCDRANNIVRYEYDSFNRLKLVKDKDGKILKRMDYKYLDTN